MRSSTFVIRSLQRRQPIASYGDVPAGHHGPFRTLHSARRTGISMLEVLISIGIVAIGLVSIAALIPVGGVQVQKSNVEERKATLGLNAFREFQIRRMEKMPSANRMTDSTYNPNNHCAWISAAGPTTPLFTYSVNQWVPTFSFPVVIDPLMVAAGGTAVDSFPANAPVGLPILKRLSLTSVYSSTQSTYQALAAAVFTAADDVVTNLPSDVSQSGSGVLDSSNSKQDYNGEFTWLATLAPNYLDTASINPSQMNQLTLSIVVFDRRQLITPVAATDEQGQEEIVSAVSTTPAVVSISGGEFTLSDSSANASAKLGMARPNQWLMLTRYLPVAASTAPWLEAKWFRVVAAGNITQSGSTYSRQITLAGADWEPDPTAANVAYPAAPYIPPGNVTWPTNVPSGSQNYNTYACLFDGAVAVYQRVIHLEGPSVWSQ